jgi:hypothetical protein
MEIKQISVQEIDEDPFFRFSSEKDIFQLRESVLKDGIRTPVQVIPHKGKYRLEYPRFLRKFLRNLIFPINF